MTLQEKLAHFQTAALSEAKQESLQAIEEHRQVLENLFQQHVADKERQLNLQLKTEADRMKRQNNIELSKERLRIKREISDKQEQLKEQLFSEVREKLDDFKATEKYQELLIRQIQDILAYAGKEQVEIYIDPADASYLPAIEAAVKHPVTVSDYSFGGGTRGILSKRRILIDNSFDTRLDEVKKGFCFDGGVRYE